MKSKKSPNNNSLLKEEEYFTVRREFKKSFCEIISVQNSSIKLQKVLDLLGVDDMDMVSEVIEELLKEGKIIVTNKGKILSTKISGLVPARIVSMSKTFSFAIPIDSSISDVYISRDFLKGARVGDVVLLKHIRHSKGGFSARVERITYKSDRFVKGIFVEIKKKPFFVADKSYNFKVPVGKKFIMGAKHLDKVKAVIVEDKNGFIAKIIKIYGSSSSAQICAKAVIDSYSIPVEFSPNVIKAAKKFESRKISDNEIKRRLDLRDQLVFTIDGEDAKDLDDAISIKKTNDIYELSVHIADVSHYIRHKSAIDMEARNRGTSVYFADKVIPMLPKQISNGVCSLNSGEDKLTFSVIMRIDSSGKTLDFKIKKSIINSKVRGVYSEVNQIIEGTAPNKIKEKYKEVTESIFVAKELFNILLKESEKRGQLYFNESEPYILLDQDGKCIDVKPRTRGISEKIIEQFMVKANETVASFALKSELPFVYRVHRSPSGNRLENLFGLMKILGIKCPKISEEVSINDIKFILDQVKGKSSENLISNRLIRSMSKAIYSNIPEGHFGLALKDYCHFTSPIRRYPDLAIHRILSRTVSKTKKSTIKQNFYDFVVNVSEQSTQCEVRAMNAERDAERCYIAEYVKLHVSEIFNGTICGINSRMLFVDLENSVSGFIKIESFKNKNLVYDGLVSYTDSVSGKRFCIGDKITIKILNANVSTGAVEFVPV